MPRKPIDYANTTIYKLCCNDADITDIYVGHTTDFTCRKSNHKSACNNEKGKDYHYYVYQFIRYHGGWVNWSMIEIERVSCIDKNDALKNERKWIELLGTTLNKTLPTRTDKEYRTTNAQKMSDDKKQYYLKNRDRFLEIRRQYRETNREEINKKQNLAYRLKKVSAQTGKLNLTV